MSAEIWVTLLLGLFSGITGALIPMLIQYRAQKRKEQLEDEQAPMVRLENGIRASASAAQALAAYSDEIRQLREELREVREEVSTLQDKLEKTDKRVETRTRYIEVLLRGIERLIAQLRSVEQIPVWTPPPLTEE